MARRRSSAVPVVAMDSLAAVILSAMGALFFVVIYVALSAYGLSAKITTPLVSPSDTTPVFFECRDNTVFKPDITELADRTVAAFSQCLAGSYSRIQSCEQALAAKPMQNTYYSTRLKALQCPGETKPYPGISLIEIQGSKGEGLLELQDRDSAFQRELASLDPRRQHLIFVVRSDSFGVFHAARRLSRKLGFRSGWEPIDRKMELGFGCPGGQSGFRSLPQ
jgi:hypothetical protein